jgi:hypothetical protein
MALVEPGTYTLTQENVGRRYAVIAMRTQFNVMDPDDLGAVHALQDQLKIEQKDTGSFTPSGNWDMEAVLAMRAKYQKIAQDEGVTSEVMFGKKGEVPLKEHNAGTAIGWGGLTPERAVYPGIFPDSIEPQTLTLKDVPAGTFCVESETVGTDRQTQRMCVCRSRGRRRSQQNAAHDARSRIRFGRHVQR